MAEASSERRGRLPVQIQRLDPDIALPEYAHAGDAGCDLRARTSCVLAPGERRPVPTGVAVAIPEGWAGLVLPRSGHARRHGISMVNAPGLIDAGYRGELEVLLINHDRSDAFEIRRGDRIAQLVLTPVAAVVWDVVDELPGSRRGAGGFGSSGQS